ncbi:MAG: hypothetical protein AAFP84_01295 [Actinomycetota bacterium]
MTDATVDASSLPLRAASFGRRRAVITVLVVALLAGASVLLTTNVEVSNDAVGTRSCGSAVDSLVDRSGWEVWWARDLDEPDVTRRAELLRTTRCPDAVDRRLAVSGLLLAAACSLLVVRGVRRQADRPRHAVHGRQRLDRLGRATRATGVGLGLAGVAATLMLVADAEATLFLYVDRVVVLVVGLIVIVPTLALVAIGHALTLVASEPVDGEPEVGPGAEAEADTGAEAEAGAGAGTER